MLIERELYKRIKPLIKSPEAIIVTGMRRVGKTSLLKSIYDKIDSENKIFFDLENPLNQKFFDEEDYEKIISNLRYKGFNTEEKGYVFLDEIQSVRNITSIVKYLIDHYKIKFFLTGSASFYLKNLFSESLAGRKYIFELFPLSFPEFLDLKGVNLKIPKRTSEISKAVHSDLSRYYDEYLLYGGFPGVVSKKSIVEKKLSLNDVFTSYFQLEIKQLGDFRKTNLIRDLILLLFERIGQRLDITKLSSELGVSRETIYNYISFLESTYFIKLIRPFSKNKDAEIRTIPKFYICDTGLANYFTKIDQGNLFENSVFWALSRKGEVNYYQRSGGPELDFILDKKSGFEVKLSPSEIDIKKMSELGHKLGLKSGHMISKNYCKLKRILYGYMI